jgi:pimeloyl-ACP methyl ester carboxylesterase
MRRPYLIMTRILVVIVAAGLMFKPLVAWFEPRLLFFPYKGEDENPDDLGIRYEQVRVSTSDGERLVAWQMEPDDPTADIVYFHGNGGNLSVWLPVLVALHRFNYRVLAVDYRGYGLSTGSPDEEGLYRDAEATVRHAAATRGDAARPLIFWGRSLGAAIAASATRVISPDGLILESAFPEKAAVIRRQPLLRLFNTFSSYRFPTVELLRDFRKPVLVIHGDRDSIVPFRLGRELFERLTSPKQFVIVRGGDHNDLFDRTNEAYWGPIAQFIDDLR